MDVELGPVWASAVRRLGGTPDPGDALELARRYGEAHRRYHGVAHLRAVLRETERLGGEVDLPARDRAVVTLAAAAHDVVYNAQPGQDERASADWVRARLDASGVPPVAVAEVVRLVLATLDHVAAPGDLPAAVLLDADLSILGAAPEEYAAYVAGVRQEYAAASDEAWRTGRAAVLAGLLARDPLFRTDPARRRWAVAARRNVEAELAALS